MKRNVGVVYPPPTEGSLENRTQIDEGGLIAAISVVGDDALVVRGDEAVDGVDHGLDGGAGDV